MPTRRRQEGARRALFAFLAQCWLDKELIVVDDGDDPSCCGQDFLMRPFGYPGMPNILFSKVQGLTLGEKRNKAIEMAKGSIILHWDDDDLYRPDRIEHQVSMLMAARQIGADVVGYDRMLFLDVDSGERFQYARPGYLIGNSSCYWKSVWEQRQFAARNEAEDQSFLNGRKTMTCDSGGRIVATIHGGNTVDKRPLIASDPEHWERAA